MKGKNNERINNDRRTESIKIKQHAVTTLSIIELSIVCELLLISTLKDNRVISIKVSVLISNKQHLHVLTAWYINSLQIRIQCVPDLWVVTVMSPFGWSER